LGNCSFFPIWSQIKNANSASLAGKADKILINKNMSLWKAQAVWDVKDFNLWRGVSVTEPQKTPHEAWRSLCCFRCDVRRGIWYLGVVMPHTAHMQLQAKKTEFWRKCKKIPGRFNNMLRFFCFVCFRCLCFTEQLQFSAKTQHRLIFYFCSTLALKYPWGDSWIYCVIVQWWMIVQLSMGHWSTNHWKSKRSWWIFRSSISIDWAWPGAALQGRMNACCKQTVLSKLPSRYHFDYIVLKNCC